jgi:hypothetical protein
MSAQWDQYLFSVLKIRLAIIKNILRLNERRHLLSNYISGTILAISKNLNHLIS